MILRDYLWPLLKGREIASASEVWDLLAPVRGHNMAKAALETAVWDAEAKQKNLPLAKLLGGTRAEIPCGVSIGIQPTIDELIAKVEEALAAGYQRIKIKIKPGNGHRAGARAARALPAHSADGGRQFRLSPRRRAAARSSSTPST